MDGVGDGCGWHKGSAGENAEESGDGTSHSEKSEKVMKICTSNSVICIISLYTG